MKARLALLLAMALAVEAPAQSFKAVKAPVRPVAPGLGSAAAPTTLAAPSLSATLPAAPAQLPKPVLPSVAAPMPAAAAVTAAAAAAPSAAPAMATLEAARAATADPAAAPKSAEGGWTAGRAAFDAGASPSGSAPAVSVPALSAPRSGLARPAAAANQVSGRAAPEAPRGGAKVRAFEFAETAFYGGGAALLSGLLVAALGGSLWLAPAMGLASHAGSRVMFDVLGGLRGRVVDGWQASHDQRYRVGGDGRLRDVRGHKYGADRYERYAPGPVGTAAAALIRAAAFAAGAAWLAGAGLAGYSVYAAVFIGLEILAARGRAKAAADSGPVSEEGRAHAARFDR